MNVIVARIKIVVYIKNNQGAQIFSVRSIQSRISLAMFASKPCWCAHQTWYVLCNVHMNYMDRRAAICMISHKGRHRRSLSSVTLWFACVLLPKVSLTQTYSNCYCISCAVKFYKLISQKRRKHLKELLPCIIYLAHTYTGVCNQAYPTSVQCIWAAPILCMAE